MFFSGINNVCSGIVWEYLGIYIVFKGTLSREKIFLKALNVKLHVHVDEIIKLKVVAHSFEIIY
jgi:hypothetical protein